MMFGVGVPIETARSALALNGNNGVVPSIHTYRSAFLIGTAPHSVFSFFCLFFFLLFFNLFLNHPKQHSPVTFVSTSLLVTIVSLSASQRECSSSSPLFFASWQLLLLLFSLRASPSRSISLSLTVCPIRPRVKSNRSRSELVARCQTRPPRCVSAAMVSTT